MGTNRAKSEMMALVGGCVQDRPNYLVPPNLKGEFSKIITGSFQIETQPMEGKRYDLIIEEKPSSAEKVKKRLSEVGIYITSIDSLVEREIFRDFSNHFEIVMPYYFITDNFWVTPLLFASLKYHPTADIIRHRSDFVEDAYYYTTDIHLASFQLPRHIFNKIRDVIRI
ncbi:MAG: spermidine synthase [Epsilonproteobacteria bacterium]|jgi:spermidine synthase|nr:spermidine synthase [Campylobacterota bacterium]NPA89574.1 spermidine synthase [Campylobacterota bacterium]